MFACISKCLDTHTHTHTRKKAKSTHSHIASGGGRKPSYVQHTAEVIRRQNKYPGMFKNSYPNIIQPSTQTQTHTDSVVSQPRVSPTHQSKPRIPPDCAARILEANIQGTPHCEAHYSQLTRLPAGNTRKHTHRWIHSCAHADTHRSGWCGCLASQKLIESRSITVLISILVSVVNNNLRGPRKTEMLIKKAEGRFQYSAALCACFVFDPSSYCTRLQQSNFFVFVFKIIFSINLEKKLHTVLYWWTWDNTAHLKLEGLFSKCHAWTCCSWKTVWGHEHFKGHVMRALNRVCYQSSI